MIDDKYYNLTEDEENSSDFWLHKLYDIAYLKIDEKIPIVIPTYNRPNCLFLQWVTSNFSNNETWPIFLVVRESQVQMYESSEYVKDYNYINVVGFPDEQINDIGKVRKTIVEYFSKQYKYIFMFDDDITTFTYLIPHTRKTGGKVSKGAVLNSPARIFAMWQLAAIYAFNKRADVFVCSATNDIFNWQSKYCDSETSLNFMSGRPTLAICLNLDVLNKFNLNYRTIKGNGHDDIDLWIRAIKAGCTACNLNWVSFKYNMPKEGTLIYHNEDYIKRFLRQLDEMYIQYKDLDWVKFNRSEIKISSVGVYWKRAIKYHNSLKTAIPIDKDELVVDLSKHLI